MRLSFSLTLACTAAAVAYAGLPGDPDQRPPSLPQNVMRADSVGPENRTVVVTALSDNIYRVDNYAPGQFPAKSKMAVMLPAYFTGDYYSGSASQALMAPNGNKVLLDNRTGNVCLITPDGKGLTDSGRRGKDATGRRTMQLDWWGEGDAFYGAGERGYRLNLAGDTLVMYNRQNYGYTGSDPRIRQMNITMPLLITPDGLAVLMDDFAAAEMVAGSQMSYASESPNEISYYIIASDEGMPGATKELTRLTGRQPLAPFWSLGYISSKYGYHDQAETIGVADTLRREGYPLDGMVLDLYWYGKEQDMGRLDWDPEQWPDHRKMLADLKKRGIKMVNISQPYVLRNGRGLDNYNYLSQNGMLGKDSVGDVREVTIWVGEGGMLDVSNPETVKWLRERYKQLTDGGVTGWWGDLGEPEVHPDSMYHANGLTTRQYHNIYGNDWSQIIYDLFREEYPETRLMTMMRGGTAGLQRFAVYPWSTDVSRSWGGLEPQIRIMLNSGLSGLGYMSHDVGGFAVDPEHPYDPELYVRWCQLGLFSPILRTHAQQFAEPYNYPQHKDILLPLVRERYRWLPYNYTLAAENALEGLPLVRPLGYYDENPALLDSVSDQYLWGRDVMVAPVMTQGAVSRKVVFPSGEWVDINDPAKVYAGGTEAVVDAPLAVLPLFARAGALLPKADYKMQNTGDYDPARYTIDYYPTPGCGLTDFRLFEDDRTSATSLSSGKYTWLDITADNTPAEIALTVTRTGSASYPGMPSKRTLTFVIHNIDRPASVEALQPTDTTGAPARTLAGVPAVKAKVTSKYDTKTRTLTVTATLPDFPLSLILRK